MVEHIRFCDAKEMYGFLRDLRRKRPDHVDWDKDPYDGVPSDVNLDWLFDPVRIRLCDESVFLEDETGNPLSFGIINTSSDPPAIQSYYTLPEYRGKFRYGYRLLEESIKHIRSKRGDDVLIYFDAVSDGSQKHKGKLSKEMGVRFIELE